VWVLSNYGIAPLQDQPQLTSTSIPHGQQDRRDSAYWKRYGDQLFTILDPAPISNAEKNRIWDGVVGRTDLTPESLQSLLDSTALDNATKHHIWDLVWNGPSPTPESSLTSRVGAAWRQLETYLTKR